MFWHIYTLLHDGCFKKINYCFWADGDFSLSASAGINLFILRRVIDFCRNISCSRAKGIILKRAKYIILTKVNNSLKIEQKQQDCLHRFPTDTQAAVHGKLDRFSWECQTASNGSILSAVRRLTILNHESNMDLLLLIYRIEQCWRATWAVCEVLRESGAIRYRSFFCFYSGKLLCHRHHSPGKPMR